MPSCMYMSKRNKLLSLFFCFFVIFLALDLHSLRFPLAAQTLQPLIICLPFVKLKALKALAQNYIWNIFSSSPLNIPMPACMMCVCVDKKKLLAPAGPRYFQNMHIRMNLLCWKKTIICWTRPRAGSAFWDRREGTLRGVFKKKGPFS